MGGGSFDCGASTKSKGTETATAAKKPKVTGAKKAGKTHTRKCKCCTLYFPPEAMAVKSRHCSPCKHKIDGLTRICNSQGKGDWWRSTRQDDAKVWKCRKAYKDLTGDDGSGQTKKAGLIVS